MFERSKWLVGDRKVFRLSKDNCQKFLHALLVCDGKIHGLHSSSIDRQNNKIYDGIRVGSADALFSISIKKGTEDTFRDIMGDPNCLEVPIELHLN
jgi:hypothetical protein